VFLKNLFADENEVVAIDVVDVVVGIFNDWSGGQRLCDPDPQSLPNRGASEVFEVTVDGQVYGRYDLNILYLEVRDISGGEVDRNEGGWQPEFACGYSSEGGVQSS